MAAWQRLLALLVCAWCANAWAAGEELKISQLEQDVRELQRQTQQQARRIDTLEQQLARATINLPASSNNAANAGDRGSAIWLSIANWDRVKPGMTELEVLKLIGPPTTLRKSPDGKTQSLLYALELGAGSFLSGVVTMADGRVQEVQKPALK
jgi:hypothetical protein